MIKVIGCCGCNVWNNIGFELRGGMKSLMDLEC